MLRIFKRWREEKAKKKVERALKLRRDQVLAKYGCVCYCPYCKDILNDQAKWISDLGDNPGFGLYLCKCGKPSKWNFSLAPVPLCLD
jgi:hypothetical protein